jgi:hypothetical protein
MPPVSEKQRRLMWAARSSKAVAKRTGVSQKVAKEFTASDKGGKLPEQAPNSRGTKWYGDK